METAVLGRRVVPGERQSAAMVTNQSPVMKLLLIEDDALDAMLVRELLLKCPNPPQVLHSGTLQGGLSILKSKGIDLVLLDLGLPDNAGTEALDKILEQRFDVPIVVMTGRADESFGIDAVHRGAQDYLIKGQVNSDLLRRSIMYAIERKKLANALKQRTTELEVANKGLEAFNDVLAHDLRAPLHQIDAYVALLEEGAALRLDESSKRYLRNIRERSAHMAQLLDDLRNLSQLSGQELHFQSCNLNVVAEDALRDVKQGLENRVVEWRMAELPKVACDPAAIRQVLIHLLSNALKFTRGSNPSVIEIGHIAKAEEVILFVRDNGVGFNMRHVGRLFQAFQRLHGRDEFPGTGIGLVIVRQIVQRHGGHVWAEAELNKGATFYFTLPTGDGMRDSKAEEGQENPILAFNKL